MSDNPKKPWDPKKPLLRINSPTARTKRKLNGNGHARGTRRPNPGGPRGIGPIVFGPNGTGPKDDFLSRGFLDRNVRRQMVVVIPSWVPTEGQNNDDETPGNVELECAGTLARSFQTWTDAPPIQYHKWYDWNFMVVPDPEYAWVRGAANLAPNLGFDPEDPEKQIDPMGRAVVDQDAIEGEWDAGAIGAYRYPSDPNDIYRNSGNAPGGAGNDARWTGGPMYERDWAWPMTDDYMWMVGRSIYDGGHEQKERCRSELHPVKAIATVRKEGFVFKRLAADGKQTDTPVHKGKIPDGSGKVPQGLAVPAHQFLFYSNVHGGYFEWPNLDTRDGKPYEFIVDLPEAPWLKGPEEVAVGPSDQVKLNTIVLREQELMVDFDHERFEGVSRGFLTKTGSTANPKVEVLPDLPDPGNVRKRQVKITIGADCLTNEFYGVLVSLGWRDHSGITIARVRTCAVKFKTLKVGTHPGLKTGDQKDRSYERWRLKGGVQGRWRQFNFDRAHPEPGAPPPPTITAGGTFPIPPPPAGVSEFQTFFLDEDVELRFSTHGAELQSVDDVFFDESRTVVVDELDTIFVDPFHGPSFIEDEEELPFGAEEGGTDRKNADAFMAREGKPPLSWDPPPLPPLGPENAVIWDRHIDPRLPREERPKGDASGKAIDNGDTDAWRWQCMRPVGRAALRGFFNVMAKTQGDESRPLGIIDAHRGPPGEKNPFPLKGLKSQTDDTIELTAFYAWELGHLAELVEKMHADPAAINDASRWDYKISIQIKTTAQYK